MLRLPRLSISKGGLTGRSAPNMLREQTPRIADPDGLDLQHVGPPVGEDAARRGPRHPHPHLDDLHSLHRTRHAVSPSLPQPLRLGYPFTSS